MACNLKYYWTLSAGLNNAQWATNTVVQHHLVTVIEDMSLKGSSRLLWEQSTNHVAWRKNEHVPDKQKEKKQYKSVALNNV